MTGAGAGWWSDRAVTRRAALAGLSRLAAGSALAVRPSSARAGAGTAAAPDFVRADDPRLTVEGRTAPGPDGALRVGYPGVALRFRADAPRVTLRVTASSEDCYVDVVVGDGATAAGAPRRVPLARGAQELVLHDGAAGRRTFEVLKRTESWQGTLEVAGIGGVGSIEPVPLPARRLLFVGDSITCGASSDVPDASSTEDGAQTSDGAKSFGRVLAARLGAACHLVGYGGRGVIRDWRGIRDVANAPVFYERAMPDDAATPWDHRRFVPHGVGVCLGTNDFNQGVPDENEFVNAYVEFLRKMTRDAPDAPVFVIDSPIVADTPALGHRATILRDYLDEVVRRVDEGSAGARVRRAHVGHYPGRRVNSHPIASEHVAMARELEPQFRAALGWER
ncbi:hypothetical protein tb265_24760 [Gemmatimonadetes bacterium T265]|nr:hypothetical protein tb265_24760 [Gemmatimonadetes bacterium T265]